RCLAGTSGPATRIAVPYPAPAPAASSGYCNDRSSKRMRDDWCLSQCQFIGVITALKYPTGFLQPTVNLSGLSPPKLSGSFDSLVSIYRDYHRPKSGLSPPKVGVIAALKFLVISITPYYTNIRRMPELDCHF